MLLKGIKTLINRHTWFHTSSDNNGVKLVFETMNRALLGDPLELQEQAVDDLRLNQASTENGFKKCVNSFTEKIRGEDAVDNLKDYIRNERNPKF